jgi:hypothetical protein
MVGSHRGEKPSRGKGRKRRSFGQVVASPFVAFGGWTVEHHKKISLALVGVQAALGAAIRFVADPLAIVGLVVAMVSVAMLIAGLGLLKVKRIDDERIEAAVEIRVAISDSLEPTVVHLGRMVDGPIGHRRNEFSGMCKTVLSGAVGLAPSDARPRSCYFRLDDAGGTMAFADYQGRAVQPKAEFRAGTPEGDAALAMVRANDILYCDDVDENPPPGWRPSDRGAYKTFIAVPVKCSSTVFGMLTLDATVSGALTEEDGQLLRVLGVILGIAEQARLGRRD